VFSGKFALVSLQPVANLPPVSTTPAIPVGNLQPVPLIPVANLTPVFLTLAANLPPVSLILVVHFDLRISPQIFEKFEIIVMLLSWAWSKMIHQKSRDTDPLKCTGFTTVFDFS
jgi:hypothetical protein